MKQIITLLAFLPLALSAQVTWEVEAGGSTMGGTPPYYTPADLTIAVGDEVHWHGVSGTHNVYGGLDDFPANPEAFSSGQATQNLSFTYTFTLPGVYGYHCTQMGHAVTQHGTITVESAQNVAESSYGARSILFPVPANNTLTVQLEDPGTHRAEVFSVDGRVLMTATLNGTDRSVLDLENLTTGRYLLRITDQQGRSFIRPFLKN